MVPSEHFLLDKYLVFFSGKQPDIRNRTPGEFTALMLEHEPYDMIMIQFIGHSVQQPFIVKWHRQSPTPVSNGYAAIC